MEMNSEENYINPEETKQEEKTYNEEADGRMQYRGHDGQLHRTDDPYKALHHGEKRPQSDQQNTAA